MARTNIALPDFDVITNTPDQLDEGIAAFPHLHEKVLRWVSLGVYYGYPRIEIMEFYNRISNGIPAPRGTLFGGTGYVMTECKPLSKEEHIAQINARRYCPVPFPDSPSVEKSEAWSMIKMLLNCDPEFRDEVWSILEAL